MKVETRWEIGAKVVFLVRYGDDAMKNLYNDGEIVGAFIRKKDETRLAVTYDVKSYGECRFVEEDMIIGPYREKHED